MRLRPLTALLLTGVLSACGSSATSDRAMDHGSMADTTLPSVPAEAAYNGQDVVFTRDMIAHHQSGVAMARLAESRSTNDRVKALAQHIDGDQTKEVTTLLGFLSTWGVANEGASSDHSNTSLKDASAESFDREFLIQMSQHHQDAIDMARLEQANGKYPATQDLANSIVTTQGAEVAEMSQLLEGLPVR